MSLVTAFATSMHAQAAPMIGQEPVIVGGVTLSCVLAEISDSKEFGEGGFEKSKSLSAVCRAIDLPNSDILKKVATARGDTFRVEGISRGAVFATMTLNHVTKA